MCAYFKERLVNPSIGGISICKLLPQRKFLNEPPYKSYEEIDRSPTICFINDIITQERGGTSSDKTSNSDVPVTML